MVEYFPPLIIPSALPPKPVLRRPFLIDKDCVLCYLPEINTLWLDQTPQGNNGTLHGPTRVYNGRRGPALSFDGSDDYVDLGACTALNVGVFSIELWANTTARDLANWDRIIQAPERFTHHWSIMDYPKGTRYVVANGTEDEPAAYYTPYNSMTTGAWEHIVFTDDGTTKKVYINAVSQTLSDSGDVSTPIDGTVWLGRRQDGADPYLGFIDELRFYTRVLTQQEITALYNMG